MTTEGTPVTEAGRRLLADIVSRLTPNEIRKGAVVAILAIENEAAAAAARREEGLRTALEGLRSTVTHGGLYLHSNARTALVEAIDAALAESAS